MNKTSDTVYNSVVIGGGVAGLSAAYQLSRFNRRVLVIDQGSQLFKRSRMSPFDIANGIGGAGLYSDGKLSLYPSASNLWTLDKDYIQDAYQSFQEFISQFGVNIADFPNDAFERQEFEPILHKRYESLMLTLEQRMQMVYAMAMEVGSANMLTNATIKKISKIGGRYHLEVITNEESNLVVTESIILAGGKYSFDFFRKVSENISLDDTRERYEVGMRAECANEYFDCYNDEQTDVKIIDKSCDYHVRTFCCCRDGIVVKSKSYEYESYNGSSGEIVDTHYSNIGFVISVPKLEAVTIREKYSDNSKENHQLSLKRFMKGEREMFTKNIDDCLRSFLITHFPKMCTSDAKLYFPVYERFGVYPNLSNTLRYGNENIWVIGDATGIFRGMMPAFVSGFLAAIVSRSVVNDDELYSKLHIKTSSTRPCKTIFTAQSKQTFYCRDAVCQFVFQKGAIPVNPFRVFDYFLGERVDRDLIRRGNNELIRRSDELWVFGQVSDGVLFEIATCRQTGKKIRFFTISSKVEEIKEISPGEVSFEPEVHKHQVKRGDLMQLLEYGDSIYGSYKQLTLFT